MRVLVVNRSDSASLNIRDRLLDTGDWPDTGSRFRGHAMYQRGYDILLQVDGPVVTDETLSADIAEMDWPVGAVWFLSRHRAASGAPSLTVHPIGNHADADFGGMPSTLSPAAPRDMGALLRRLRHHRDAADLPHSVTYEATHHGPGMQQPSLFVEIGSDDAWYEDRQSGEVLAAAITDVLEGEGLIDAPLALGIGGGHYVPQQTDKALAGLADFGHFVPAYALEREGADADGILARAWAATPDASAAYMHKKGLKGPQRQAVRAWMEARGVAGLEQPGDPST